jgi:DNA-binding GntR family transcriptional regulator
MAALAVHYGVSRSTVAKALKRMADDGLVEIVPQWGTFRT